MTTKATKHLILAATFALTIAAADRASAYTGIVANGSCTPKVGDDVEVSIHTPQGNNPAIGQRAGVKYFLMTVIQGGKRSGKSIKGGKRTGLMFKADQKALAAVLKAAGSKNKNGAKLGMGKITAVSGKFQFGTRDVVDFSSARREIGKLSFSRKGKALGSVSVKWD